MKLYNLDFVFQNEQIKLFIYVSKIVFPHYYCCAFPLYMFLQYYKIKQHERVYSMKILDVAKVYQIAATLGEHDIDENYSVIINNKFVEDNYGIMSVEDQGKVSVKFVKLIQSNLLQKGQAAISCSLSFNVLGNFEMKDSNAEASDLNIRIKGVTPGRINFADVIELALINSPCDVDNIRIDTLIKNYFETPKLLHESDVIEINVKSYSKGLPMNIGKIMNLSTTVYFKCVKIFSKTQQFNDMNGYFIVIGETTIKQVANTQCYIPSQTQILSEFDCSFNGLYGIKNEIGICPTGLEKYLVQIEKAVKPFLRKNYNVNPVFLLVGKKGCGKEILIRSVALKFGMHFYKITNFDVTGSVYVQNEVKLKNILFNVKLCAPCVIYMKNFEHFEKNQEGQTDERVVANFVSGLKMLFEKNTFPVILFCSSNEENICARLNREFLQVFKIDTLNENQRVKNLEWLLRFENLSYDGDIQEIAQKTNNFLFEDMKALVKMAKKFDTEKNEFNLLDNDSFSASLDYLQLRQNTSIGAPKVPKVQWDDIGGLDEVKQEIMKTINFPLKHPKLLMSTGLRRFGILLFGPPGTGKTLLAKAVATECNICFLSIKGPELLNMYIGQSEENIREVFQRARDASPCIIFFDELDSLAPNRGVSGDSGGVMDRVVSQLLAEMDGLNDKATIFIIGATNRPDLIDPALLRPGRFDKLLYVGPSMDFSSRLSILKALTRRFRLANDVILEDVIEICPGNISGADFYGICSNSWIHAVRRLVQECENGTKDIANLTGNDVIVSFKDFENALSSVKPSVTTDDLRYFEKLKNELGSNI